MKGTCINNFFLSQVLSCGLINMKLLYLQKPQQSLLQRLTPWILEVLTQHGGKERELCDQAPAPPPASGPRFLG